MQIISWKPQTKIKLPIYKQIVEFVKAKISKGEWPVGSILPSQRELAQQFQVNRSTISIAIDELIADGLLESKVGSGTRVINSTWSLLKPTMPPNWNHYVEAGLQQPNSPKIQKINQTETLTNIIKLGKCELAPEFYPSEHMQEVLTSLPLKIKSLGYEEPNGLLPLREQISAYLKTWNINVSPSSILIVSGALQALQLISLGLSPQGSTVLLEKPSYLFSLNLFQTAGINFCGLPMDKEGIMLAPLANQKRQTNGAFLYTIPCFHNPTGISMTANRRRELMALCEKEQLPIIEDDVYRELWLDSPPPFPLKAIDNYGFVLHIGSLSKTLSPGLRIGWVVGPESVINRLADLKMQNDYGSSSLSQWVAAEWLSNGLYQHHLEIVRSQLRTRRKICLELLEKHFKDIATWNTPSGGLYIWLTLQVPISIPKLFKVALTKGLLLSPGNIFDPQSNKQLRISFSYPSVSELKEGLILLASIIKELLMQPGS